MLNVEFLQKSSKHTFFFLLYSCSQFIIICYILFVIENLFSVFSTDFLSELGLQKEEEEHSSWDSEVHHRHKNIKLLEGLSFIMTLSCLPSCSKSHSENPDMLEEKPNMATQKEEEEDGGSAAQQVTKESRCFQEWRYSILFLQAEKSFQAPFHAFESVKTPRVSYSNFDIYTICSMKKKNSLCSSSSMLHFSCRLVLYSLLFKRGRRR